MVDVVPKPEHPRPQFVRKAWLNLNGRWEFEHDPGDSGIHRGLLDRALAGEIVVPFAPESTASGVGTVDFLHAVWYRRTVDIPAEWAGKEVLLHFGAVDHDATVWVNGVELARHRGGFTPFAVRLRGVAGPGERATIVVRARDTPDAAQARGKQATWYDNTACFYTRTTGIWQTVWLEAVAPLHIREAVLTPQCADRSLTVTCDVAPVEGEALLEVVVRDEDGEVASGSVAAAAMGASVRVEIPEDRFRLWRPGGPELYDVDLRLTVDGEVVDEVASYAGFRSVALRGNRVLINGEPVFQRLVLDQGYWPESLMTSPSDDALVADIRLSMDAGFNGARLHQKVFEERYLYHADRLGYLVWGEFGDWGCSGQGPEGDNQRPTASYVTQWLEAVRRDRSHPSIVGWCPLNETYQVMTGRITQLDDVTSGMFLATKLADPTRPVLDASGYAHRVREADVYDSHSYEQDPAAFAEQQAGLSEGRPHVNLWGDKQMSVAYAGQPYFVSEYGGIWWNPVLLDGTQKDAADPTRDESWGYGDRVGSVEEWFDRFRGLTDVLLDNPDMFGYCYTQLTDTFQEENGLYAFDRTPKFDIARVREIQQRVAAYERPQAAERSGCDEVLTFDRRAAAKPGWRLA